MTACPHCHSERIQRFGRNRNKTQRFRCSTCLKSFSEPRDAPLGGYLPVERAVQVVHLLCEGSSIRACERLSGVHHTTIFKLLRQVGDGCERLLRTRIRGVPVENVEVDEVWSYCGKKQRRLSKEEAKRGDLGDVYLYTALESNSRLILTWLLGKRNERSTADFVSQLRDATGPQHFQLSSDGYQAYPNAVWAGLHDRVAFGQIVKLFGRLPEGRETYRPAKIRGTIKVPVLGNPNPAKICTSHCERLNGTLRTWSKRHTRLTYCFSRRWENLRAACGLFVGHYNWCHAPTRRKTTAAMESGLTSSPWTIEELIREAAAS